MPKEAPRFEKDDQGMPKPELAYADDRIAIMKYPGGIYHIFGQPHLEKIGSTERYSGDYNLRGEDIAKTLSIMRVCGTEIDKTIFIRNDEQGYLTDAILVTLPKAEAKE